METEGEFLVSSPGHSEVSTPHIVKEEEDQFPLKGFPYMGSIPISVYWNLPLNYVTLAQLVLGTSSASSLYHNPVWGSGAMPTMAPFISNPTPQQTLILQLLQSRCNPPFRTILYRQSKTPIWCNWRSRVLPLSVLWFLQYVHKLSHHLRGRIRMSLWCQAQLLWVAHMLTWLGWTNLLMVLFKTLLVLLDQVMSSTNRSKIPLICLGQAISSISSLMRLRFSTKLLVFHMVPKEW